MAKTKKASKKLAKFSGQMEEEILKEIEVLEKESATLLSEIRKLIK